MQTRLTCWPATHATVTITDSHPSGNLAMPAKTLNTLDVRTRKQWRSWLVKSHDSVAAVWLMFHKPLTKQGVP